MALTLLNAAGDLATYLNGKTAGSTVLTLGSNLFGSLVWPKKTGVYCLNAGGKEPTPYCSGTASAILVPNVQVLFYSPAGGAGYVLGDSIARGTMGLLQQSTISGYVYIQAEQSQPTYLGLEPETGENFWSANISMCYTSGQ